MYGWLLICAGVLLLGVVVVVFIVTDYRDMIDNWIINHDDIDDI